MKLRNGKGDKGIFQKTNYGEIGKGENKTVLGGVGVLERRRSLDRSKSPK